MRTALLAMTAALILVIGQQPSDPQKPKTSDPTKPLPADVGPGRIAWFDLTTSNLQKSKEFYAKLFEWTFTAVQGTNQAVEIVSRGTAIGTLRGAEGAISPYNGVVYVQVTDIQASCKKATELGATVIPGFPFDLPGGIGAIALIAEPGGHPLGMYSRTPIASPGSPAK